MSQEIFACHCCGLIQIIDDDVDDKDFFCIQCHSKLPIAKAQHWSRSPSFAFAAAALILYVPAILLPILRIDQFGTHHSSSLLGGTMELIRHGSWFVGGIVLLFSIVLPFLKMLGIIELICLQWSSPHHRAWVYRFVEAAGRWGMLDVLLLAMLVMLVKVGNIVEFQLGPAVVVFVACVVCNILASLFFNPRLIWSAPQHL